MRDIFDVGPGTLMQQHAPLSMQSEYKRKVVHIGSSVFIFLLRWLTYWQAAILALVAFLFNLLLLPKIGGTDLYREEDHKRGYPIGILLYPLSVLMLILFFPHRLYIAAAAWAIMAWGDGAASIIGRRWGTRKLPWNCDRSWAGSGAFLLFGGTAAVFFTFWTWKEPHGPIAWYAIGIPLLGCLIGGLVESVPSGINDNITVPLAAGFVMFGLYQIDPAMLHLRQAELIHNFFWGFCINLVLAGISLALRMVNVSGFISGLLIGTLIYTFGGYESFVVLFAFFVLGSGATKFGYARKKFLGVAQEKEGARGWKNATANCTVGAFLTILAMLTREHREIFVAGFFGAFATAAADTVSSEIGQVLGKHPILITTFRPVAIGTEGAVSLEGTVAGIFASLILCALGVVLGLISIPAAGLCVIAAFIGTTMESYLGATLETMKVIDNEIINFLNTLIGATSAMILAGLLL